MYRSNEQRNPLHHGMSNIGESEQIYTKKKKERGGQKRQIEKEKERERELSQWRACACAPVISNVVLSVLSLTQLPSTLDRTLRVPPAPHTTSQLPHRRPSPTPYPSQWRTASARSGATEPLSIPLCPVTVTPSLTPSPLCASSLSSLCRVVVMPPLFTLIPTQRIGVPMPVHFAATSVLLLIHSLPPFFLSSLSFPRFISYTYIFSIVPFL